MDANKIKETEVVSQERETFDSKLGFIMASVGSAIGLGTIWMFPYRLGAYGGAAFLIPFMIFVILFGTTGLMEEFALGRSQKKGARGCFVKIFAEKKLPFGNLIGTYNILAGTGITVFYAVVMGWVIRYLYLAVTGFSKYSTGEFEPLFNSFVGTPATIFWHALAIIMTIVVISFGVSNGIERICRIIMPLLLVVFLVLMVRSLTLPGAMEGVKYLLIPDWSYIYKPETWVIALGQAFFSVSIGGAGQLVYGSYLSDDIDIPSAAKNVVFYDILAGLVAAFVIIPAAFAFALDPTSGPPLLFVTIPTIFKAMPGGYIFGLLFFIAVLFAALSTILNLYEIPTEWLMDQFGWSRKKSVYIIAATCFVLGVPLDLDMNNFGIFADIVTIYLVPLAAVFSAILFFWVYGADKARAEINKGSEKPLGKWFEGYAKYVFVFVSGFIIVAGIIIGGF